MFDDYGGYLACVAEEGRKGFWLTGCINHGADKEAAQVTMDKLNKKLGLTKAVALRIVLDSVRDGVRYDKANFKK